MNPFSLSLSLIVLAAVNTFLDEAAAAISVISSKIYRCMFTSQTRYNSCQEQLQVWQVRK
jgi:hypothetical protein